MDASTDPSLQRVRRMSIEVPQDAVEGVALSNRVPMSVPMSAPEHVRSTSVSPHGSGSQFPALRKSLSAQAMPSSVPPVVEVAVAVTEGYGTPVSAAAVAMRRNSVVQRPSPLRRVSAVEPAMAAAVQKAPQGSPPNVTPEPNSSSAPPAAVFLSPGNSAFRRCLSGSVSPSHHDGITGTNSAMGATDRSSATPPNLSPSAPAETAVAAPAPSATVMDGILATLRASDMESRSPGVKLVPGRTPVRVSRVEAMNMEMVNTPSAEHRSGGEPSSTQSSGRRLSARPTSARRLADALAFADLAESRGLFESTGTA